MRIYIHLTLQNILETIRIVARMYNDVLNVYFTPSLTLASSAMDEIMCPLPEETLKGLEDDLSAFQYSRGEWKHQEPEFQK